MTTATATTGIHYEERGEGYALLLLHGLGAEHGMWQPQFENFSDTYRVITPDVRGAGRSAELTGWRNLLERQSEDLAALLDRLEVEQAIVCGVSYGGVLAQRFVLDYPERVRALVVVDSFSKARPPGAGGMGLFLASWVNAPFLLLPSSVYSSALRRAYARWPLAQRYLVDATSRMRRFETMKLRLAINRIDYTRKLSSISCPTLGIVGDHYKTAVEMMRVFTRATPTATLEVVPGSFDPTNLCQPEVFNRLLRDFLRRVDEGEDGSLGEAKPES